MGVDSDRGSIEAGKVADLVVVEGDVFDFSGFGDRIRAVYQSDSLVSGGLRHG